MPSRAVALAAAGNVEQQRANGGAHEESEGKVGYAFGNMNDA